MKTKQDTQFANPKVRAGYAFWETDTGETFPRTAYAAGSKLKDGRTIDLQTGAISTQPAASCC